MRKATVRGSEATWDGATVTFTGGIPSAPWAGPRVRPDGTLHPEQTPVGLPIAYVETGFALEAAEALASAPEAE